VERKGPTGRPDGLDEAADEDTVEAITSPPRPQPAELVPAQHQPVS
jgi:hypothetical protein